jgi:hypothetical protein
VLVEIKPDTVSLVSKGRWIGIEITLHADFNTSYVNLSTLLLNYVLEPSSSKILNETTIQIKFVRQEVNDYLELQGVQSGDFFELTISGYLYDDNYQFYGSDIVKIVLPVNNPNLLLLENSSTTSQTHSSVTLGWLIWLNIIFFFIIIHVRRRKTIK